MSLSNCDDAAPRCTVIAGPNGSGKSSLYEVIRPPGEFLNADVVARRINAARPESASIAAGRAVLARLLGLVEARRDFVYETTLSSNQSIALMRRAQAAGFEVSLIFVTLANARLNIQRVADRVRRGGHFIPEATILRRHRGAFEKLVEAIPVTDACLVYDNTNYEPEVLLRIQGLSIVDARLDPRQSQHVQIAQSVAKAIGRDVRDVLTGEF